MAKIIREEVERLCRKAEEEATRLKASTGDKNNHSTILLRDIATFEEKENLVSP
jgi:hypothetical protein